MLKKIAISRSLFVLTLLAMTLLFSGCKSEQVALQVNDVVSDPGAFSGNLTVVGIVNAYAQNDQTVVGIMDKKELQCTTPNCEKQLLGVKIPGARPAIGDEITVSGSFIDAPWGGKMLKADSIEILANHKLGG